MNRCFALLCALMTVAGAAQAKPATGDNSDGNACVFIRSVSDYRVLDASNLIVWAPNRRHAYLVELSMPLHSARSAFELALVDRNRDGRLCGFGMDRIAVYDSVFPQSSTVVGMTRLDEAQLAALGEQYKMRLTRGVRF